MKLVSWRHETYFHPLSCWLLSLNTSAGSPLNFLLLCCQMPETFTAASLKIRFKNEVVVVEWRSDWHYSLMMSPTALLWGNNLVQKDCRVYRASKWHYLHLACLHAIKKQDAPWEISSNTNRPEAEENTSFSVAQTETAKRRVCTVCNSRIWFQKDAFKFKFSSDWMDWMIAECVVMCFRCDWWEQSENWVLSCCSYVIICSYSII